MRPFFSLHFARQRSRICLSNSTELLRTRLYSAAILARSSSIHLFSILRQCNPESPRHAKRPGPPPAPVRVPRESPRYELSEVPLVEPSPPASIWMRFGSCTAAAPATRTSSTPPSKRAWMLFSSTPCGNVMLLRNEP